MEYAYSKAWRGYFAVCPTVFNDDFSLDLCGQRELTKWYDEQGMHGVVVAGTCGEWTALSVQERIKLFETVKQSCASNKMTLIACCSALTAKEVINFAKVAEVLDYDGIIFSAPPYVVPTDDEVETFFTRVAQACGLPIIIYNWPLGTGIDISISLLERLCQVESLVAIKNSTTDVGKFSKIAAQFQDRLQVFGILPGEEGTKIMQNFGGDGCIGAMGVLGKWQPGFFEAFWQGDLDLARSYGRKDQLLMQMLLDGFTGKYGNAIATFKYLLELRGLPAGPVREPLLGLSDQAKQKIKQVVVEHKLFDEI